MKKLFSHKKTSKIWKSLGFVGVYRSFVRNGFRFPVPGVEVEDRFNEVEAEKAAGSWCYRQEAMETQQHHKAFPDAGYHK